MGVKPAFGLRNVPWGCPRGTHVAVRVAVSLALGLFGLFGSASANAAEGESVLSVTASYAALTIDQGSQARSDERSGQGAVLGVDYQRGFGDSFWLRVGASGGLVSVDGDTSHLAVATVGLTYAVDILKYVPYVGIGAGGVLVGGGSLETRVEPILDLALGIEVQASRGFAYGIEARLESFAGQATVFVAGPRIAWRWGYF
jgi:hypothetical protein